MVLPDERTARWMVLAVHCYDACATAASQTLTFTYVGFEQTGFQPTQIGSFISSDATLNAIITLSMEHIRVSMSDVYVDTPGREDGQVSQGSYSTLMTLLYCIANAR